MTCVAAGGPRPRCMRARTLCALSPCRFSSFCRAASCSSGHDILSCHRKPPAAPCHAGGSTPGKTHLPSSLQNTANARKALACSRGVCRHSWAGVSVYLDPGGAAGDLRQGEVQALELVLVVEHAGQEGVPVHLRCGWARMHCPPSRPHPMRAHRPRQHYKTNLSGHTTLCTTCMAAQCLAHTCQATTGSWGSQWGQRSTCMGRPQHAAIAEAR